MLPRSLDPNIDANDERKRAEPRRALTGQQQSRNRRDNINGPLNNLVIRFNSDRIVEEYGSQNTQPVVGRYHRRIVLSMFATSVLRTLVKPMKADSARLVRTMLAPE